MMSAWKWWGPPLSSGSVVFSSWAGGGLDVFSWKLGIWSSPPGADWSAVWFSPPDWFSVRGSWFDSVLAPTDWFPVGGLLSAAPLVFLASSSAFGLELVSDSFVPTVFDLATGISVLPDGSMFEGFLKSEKRHSLISLQYHQVLCVKRRVFLYLEDFWILGMNLSASFFWAKAVGPIVWSSESWS